MDIVVYGGDPTKLADVLEGVIAKTLEMNDMVMLVTDGEDSNGDFADLFKFIASGKIECFLILPAHSEPCDKLIQQFASMGIKVTVISEGDNVDGFPGLDSTRRMEILHPHDD